MDHDSSTTPAPAPQAVQPAQPASGDEAQLCSQLERVESKIGTVLSLQASRRRRAIIFAVLLFCGACWFIWQVLLPFREIYQNPRSFTDCIEHDQRTIFLPILQHELQKRVPKVYAAFDQAVQTEWTKRQPKFQAMGHEFNLLLGQVNQHMSQQAALRVGVLLERYQRRLEQDFPEIAKDEAALDRVHTALQSALTTVIGSRFHRPFETMCSMRDSFQALQPTDALKKMSDGQLQESMIELITAYANLHFGQSLENLRGIRTHVIALGDQILDAAQKLEAEIPALIPQVPPVPPTAADRKGEKP